MELPYDYNDRASIIEFAKKFIGKSIYSEFADKLEELELKDTDKGKLGKVIEQLYFQYSPNSSSKADFEIAGLELKSSGLKVLKSGDIVAKERLVLSIINFFNLINEDFEKDFLQGKNGHLLLVFYLYLKGLNQLKSEIKLVGDWSYPAVDIEIIKQDWLKIQEKIINGKAHELSEGDTLYLGACTKGAKGGNFRKQPKSEILAKQRAFSIKPHYLNHIIASLNEDKSKKFGRIINDIKDFKDDTFEGIVIGKFKKYYGKSLANISIETRVQLNINQKNLYSRITHAILQIEMGKQIEEFKKANIQIKTIRISSNGFIEQHISFPAFKFIELYNESWRTSELQDILSSKFLFIFFKSHNGEFILEKAKFWNMPLADLREVRRVWLKTKKIIQNGDVFWKFKKDSNGHFMKSKKGHLIQLNNFPKSTESKVCHVRPHGLDSSKKYPLPVKDKVLNSWEYSIQCFWLDRKYILKEVYMKP